MLARDPDYWGSKAAGGGPFLDRIVMNFLDSPAAALTALRQGEAQMASLPPDPELIERAARHRRGTHGPAGAVALLRAPRPQHRGRAARRPAPCAQALAYAIDRQQVVDVLLDGSVPVLQSLLRP